MGIDKVLVTFAALCCVRHTSSQMPLPPDHPYALCPLFAAQRGTADFSTPTPHLCPSVRALRQWKGRKFGVFMHWGAFSQRVPFDGQYPGASWKLNYYTAPQFWKNSSGGSLPCAGHKEDIRHPDCPSREVMNEFRDSYWGMSKTFNPTAFDADKMMAWAKKVGIKYAVLTTKHHDGFAMWNTSAAGAPGQPLYGVCGADSPCQRDLFGEMAIAARQHGLGVGAYFSKADWHAGSYWQAPQTVQNSTAFPENTGVSYNFTEPAGRKQLEVFNEFNKAQLDEIVRNYKPDLLWLDAPWMERRCNATVQGPRDPHTPEGYGCKLDAALRIPEQAAAWAKLQPEMLVVDRGSIDFSVGRQMHPMPYDGSHYGSAEAYVTPEGGYGFKTDPKIPWETCLTMGDSWAFTNNSYDKNNVYKNASFVIESLVDVVAKGGNLLLDIGPDEHGQFPAPAVQTMEEVGKWLDVNGEAIFDSRPVWPHVFNLTTSVDVHSGMSGNGREGNSTTQLRLTRRGDAVYVALFLEFSLVPRLHDMPSSQEDADAAESVAHDGTNDDDAKALPGHAAAECWRLPTHLPLPFVVDGGVDSSWPEGSLGNVTLLGQPALALGFELGDHGLALSSLPQGCIPSGVSHVGVFKLQYLSDDN